MRIGALAQARTRERPVPHELVVGDGDGVLDVGGRAVLPGLVDAHVHLDKAYLGPLLPPGTPRTVAAAIDATAAARREVTLDQVRAGARRAVAAMVGAGTVAARVHVEVDPTTGLSLVELHRQLVEEEADRCTLQLVGFPQRGLATPAARSLLADAMDLGLDVVGGCPYVDDDPVAHLDVVFDLADRLGRPIDLHLDFDDDPGATLLPEVLARTRALGLAGRVLVGHATSLAALGADAQARIFEGLAAAGIGLVALPFSDLHLAGHGSPETRSLVPVVRAVAHGVHVAIGTNNLANAFAPLGNGSLLHAAWVTGLVQRAGDEPALAALLDAVTATPASLLGTDTSHDAVVVDHDDPTLAVAACPAVLATIRRGRVVAARGALDPRRSASTV